MNTLSNDVYTGYKVSTMLIDGFHYPYYTEFTEPSQSRIWLHYLKGNEVKSKLDNHFNLLAQYNESMEFKEACFRQVPPIVQSLSGSQPMLLFINLRILLKTICLK